MLRHLWNVDIYLYVRLHESSKCSCCVHFIGHIISLTRVQCPSTVKDHQVSTCRLLQLGMQTTCPWHRFTSWRQTLAVIPTPANIASKNMEAAWLATMTSTCSTVAQTPIFWRARLTMTSIYFGQTNIWHFRVSMQLHFFFFGILRYALTRMNEVHVHLTSQWRDVI